ncbi:hypothetical protein P0Y31_14925 [Knoellia sp. 3-2P3]|uniref:hypothetical protein n=1 Tax=unclassified Knoellia TaxID=2618719 RepID=UPI0023DC7A3E|nr:hypothetical protein [Knoellia sp. 3-2P3]MDF2093644.1 hypothetical protein [Knoellia sp. 3-2P3]
MQPSSLIFLVIIAIWAAYFIQHWVRRREHLATARSVDRFSESMRVLEHRSALPVADLSAPQPRSYAVSPARTARPEILVKRAGQAPAVDPAAAPEAAPVATARPASRLTRRTRGLTLLGSLAAILVAVGFAAFGVVPWVAVLVPVGAFAGALVWVRQGLRAEQAARRAAVGPMATGRPQARAAHAARPGQDARRTDSSSASSSAARSSVRESAPAPAPAAERQAPSSADDEPGAPVRESFYDIEAAERPSVAVDPAEAADEAPAVHAAPAMPLVDEDDIPLTWDPVPVPRPTYTMKAVASRTPAPPVAPGVPPELAEPAYDEPVRRVAGA